MLKNSSVRRRTRQEIQDLKLEEEKRQNEINEKLNAFDQMSQRMADLEN